jgi:aromatic ring hydroxylase
MATISNDQDLRTLLNDLTDDQQRIIGARFAESVIHLSHDERVNRAISTGMRSDASPDELEDAYRAAKSWSTKTYTDCGKDTDWLAQADHFVAAATAAALTPTHLLPEKTNRAWKAAMQARMANNCELVEGADDAHTDEVQRQYAIASEFIDAAS